MRRLVPKSIRKKVGLVFYGCLALILLVAGFNFFSVDRVGRRISFGMVISDVFDSTLEMRRFEKNYFLYKVLEDYKENLKYTEELEDLIDKNMADLGRITDVRTLKAELAEYKGLMRSYVDLSPESSVALYALEMAIREKGRKVVTQAERMAADERKYIQSSITFSVRGLFASMVFLSVVGVLLGQYLSSMVIAPLKELAGNMRGIAAGSFTALEAGSKDEELVSLNKAFNAMMEELEHRQLALVAQSEKLATLGTMISGVVHQINNPLSNISTSSEILREEMDTAEPAFKKELLEHITGEVVRAKALTQAILDFSRKGEANVKPLPLKALVVNTISLLKSVTPASVRVTEDVSEDLWIVADKQRVQQCLLNVIKNGIEAIPGAGLVTVAAEEAPAEKAVLIKVTDTGTGIDPEDIGKVFEPFFTTKDAGHGTGLGLLVTKEMLRELGGDIEVRSAVGDGTTFTIKVPMKEDGSG